MTSLYVRAHRIVDLGKAIDGHVEPDSVYGIALFLDQFNYGGGIDRSKDMLQLSLKTIPRQLVAAARDADQIAEKLIKAERLIDQMRDLLDTRDSRFESLNFSARAFLATLHAEGDL